MKVSIIIPVFNKLDLLQRNLFSLRCQSTVPDELIIADDGSTEDVPGFLKQQELPCKTRYVRQENKGFRLAKCRNNGVRAASGDYLILLDQDIVHTRDYLAAFVENAQPGQFLTPYPVRLSEEQSDKVTDTVIRESAFEAIITREQRQKIHKQYRDDRFYAILHRLKLRPMGPKLRGISLGLYRDDYARVNGFDENFIGWGMEDDDMGRRLHRAGVLGRNVFRDDFPIHLWHPPHHVDGERVNQSYNAERRHEIRAGAFRAEYGLDNPLDDDDMTVQDIN